MFTYLEGADHIAGQLHGDKECPFSGVTKSGRVWRTVPESSAWSVHAILFVCVCAHAHMSTHDFVCVCFCHGLYEDVC